jgi:hypothetical protein
MSWLFSQALVEAFSEASCSGGAASVRWSAMHTPQAYSWLGRTTEPFHLSQFGMTSEPLTDGHGAALLKSFRAVFRAKTSAQPATRPASRATEAGSGEKWRASFAKWNPATSTWRTAQCSLAGDLEPFSQTWPNWGLMRGGECFERAMSGLDMAAKESGSWPTPYGFQAGNGPDGNEYSTFVRRWAASHPNPNISLGATSPSDLCLNPCFVEAQMGWPIGLTDLGPLPTDKFQQWLQLHGKS